MQRSRSKNRLLLVLFLLLSFITVGYAYLSTNININGIAKINNAQWNIQLENVQETAGGITPTTAATINDDKISVTYGLTLKNPGDFYEFTVDVVNKGTIDAMISNISLTPKLSEAQQKYLAYTVSYESDVAIAKKQLLASTKKETFKVRVEFKKDITAADLPTTDTTLTLTFSVAYEQADSTAVAVNHTVCRRATTLHTETCNSYVDENGLNGGNQGCLGAGIEQGAEITYGNLGTAGATLMSGDAFDCDVNGDGTFDAATERFYYVSDLDSDSNYAVLVYYNNVSAGVPNNTASFTYDKAGKPKINGPVTAAAQLPTIAQWKRVGLTNTTRAIKDETGVVHKADFSYAGRAARLLTRQEVKTACGITWENHTKGELDSCKYLMENTLYTDSSLAFAYWLETVSSGNDYNEFASMVSGMSRSLGDGITNFSEYADGTYFGVRPAIEVLKSKISS